MTTDTTKFLETFPAWLRSLGDDAERLASLLEQRALAENAGEAIAGGVNYLFKSLDLIPDGIDDIGYLDDAFVLRVAAELAMNGELGDVEGEDLKILSRLTNEADLVREFLGKDYGRLEAYVRGLRKGAARGRSVSDILGEESVRKDFLGDVRSFAKNYETPTFRQEEKNLIKLRAFFDAKLPK